jgi:hypothetical protein
MHSQCYYHYYYVYHIILFFSNLLSANRFTHIFLQRSACHRKSVVSLIHQYLFVIVMIQFLLCGGNDLVEFNSAISANWLQ